MWEACTVTILYWLPEQTKSTIDRKLINRTRNPAQQNFFVGFFGGKYMQWNSLNIEPRCRVGHGEPVCAKELPPAVEIRPGHLVACHMATI